jgi:thioredoxin 1
MFKDLSPQDEIETLIHSGQPILLYFSADNCQVCKVLKPKLEELISRDFPLIRTFFVDIEKLPLIAARFRVFTIPTLIIFFAGKETIRKSRFINLVELRQDLERPYRILFS